MNEIDPKRRCLLCMNLLTGNGNNNQLEPLS